VSISKTKRMALQSTEGSGGEALTTASGEVERIEWEYQDRNMGDWADLEIPALRGIAPRKAARPRAMRPLLVDLLKSFEKQESHRKTGSPYDSAWR
jgi:hypothetical protein